MENRAIKEYKLIDVFDIDELQKIQDAFSKATGVASIITDKNGTPITKSSGFSFLCECIIRPTEEGLKRCMLSDSIIGKSESEVTIKKCLSAGLLDAGISITLSGKPIGIWMIGQVIDEEYDEEEMLKYAKVIGVDEKAYRSALEKVVRMPREQFDHICHFLYLNAKMLSDLATYNIVLKEEIEVREKAEEEIKELSFKLNQQQRLKAIGTLAGGIAHEINNPINGIINYSQLVLDTTDGSDEISDYMKEIIYESNRIAGIVKNLLDFSYIEKYVMKRENIREIINKTTSLISTVLMKDHISLKLDLTENVSDVMCHRQSIQQVLMNLFINARNTLNEKYPKYHENKTIIVSCREISHDSIQYVRITIEDHGNGIDEKSQDELFKPYFTFDKVEKGIGLGLPMSYVIVMEHHGHLSYETKKGEFTRIFIDLPAKGQDTLEGEN